MKKIIISILVLASISCSDFLTREPVEQVSINQQLSTKKGVIDALNGAYISLRGLLLTDADFLVYADLLSGNLGITPNNSGNLVVPNSVQNIYSFNDNSNSSDLSNFYQNSYAIINNLNLILEKVDDLQDATDSEKKQIKAESLAMRAYIHFQLAKMYSQNYTYTPDASHLGIVYNTHSLKVGIDCPIRQTAKSTFDLLENDILTAIGLYQNKKAIPSGEDKNYISKNVAKAIAADIFLWKNDWKKAYEYSNQVINESGLTLSDLYNLDNWATSEMLFELPNTINNDSPVSAIYTQMGVSRPNYTLSNDLYSKFDSTDKRLTLLSVRTYKTAGYTTNPSYRFTKKYAGNLNNAIYRLSEMYFIRAEANLKLAKNIDALADINIIRARAGLSNLTNVSIDDILLEKRKEFVFENKYFFDLMRNHKNIERKNCLSEVCNITYPNDKFVLPLPNRTIEVNVNLKQNPSY